MQSSLLIATLIIGVVTASSIIQIYHPSQFSQSPRCVSCRPSHLCILSSTHIECMDRTLAMKKMTKSKFVEYGNEMERIGGK
ncbi:hypothetical protein PENTCL1PPCAC_17766, partial [Pristionchus entomophagus]